MRGEYLLRLGVHVPITGITPTHVGNTKSLKNSNEQLEDYPHTRGEYTKQTPLHRHYENWKYPFSISSLLPPKMYHEYTNSLL